MKAFVTGGSGFVGRNLIRQLRARGDEVRALSRSSGSARLLEALGAKPVGGDLDDFAAMRHGMEGCDVVFHAAAEVGEWGTREHYWQVNVEGTRHALEAAREASVPCFVHVGTEAALCDGGPMEDLDETRPLPAQPLPRYPQTKAEAERLVRAANAPGFRTVVVRPRLIWGNDDTSVLSLIASAVKAGRFMWIEGGHYPTSTTHVDNLCEGLLRAAEKGRGGEAYFVADRHPVELRAFMERLLATRGIVPPATSIPRDLALLVARVVEWIWDTFRLKSPAPAQRVAVHLFGSPVTVRDDKARRELGYVGAVSREEGLRRLEAAKG